jgi:hypothetical protein
MATVRTSSLACSLLLCCGGALFAHRCASLWSFTVDDAYIVFRYAKNLAAGDGPTFNAGADPVEGVSQMLWLAVMAVPHLLGLDAVACAKVLGVALLAAAAAGLFFLARRAAAAAGFAPPAADLAGATAASLLAALPVAGLHAVSGLCTAMFTCAVVWWLALCARHVEAPSPGRARALAASALGLGLLRPEGNLVAAVGLTVSWLLAQGPARRRLLRAALGLYALPGAAYFAARWWYYGLPLPLPFYVKVHGAGAFGASEPGSAVAAAIGVEIGWAWVLAAAAALPVWPRALLPAAAAAAALFACLTAPAQIMGYGWRYLFPALPIGALAAGLGVGRIAHRLGAARVTLWRACAAPGIGVVLLVIGLRSARAEVAHFRDTYAPGHATAHVALGRLLATLAPRHARPVLALGDAGAVPYLSGWHTVDTFGLNDERIAVTGAHDPAHVLAAAPDVLVLISKHPWHVVPWLPWEGGLHDAAAADGFAPAKVLRFADDYYLWVMARPDGAFMAPLRAWRAPSEVPDEAGRLCAAPGRATMQLDLDYGGFQLVDAFVHGRMVGVRVRGAGLDVTAHRFSVQTLPPGEEPSAALEQLPDPALAGVAGSDRVHLVLLRAPAPPGAGLSIGLTAATPPHAPVPAVDGRTRAEVRPR